VGIPLDDALAALPFLRGLVRAAHGVSESIDGLADVVGRFGEDCFLLAVGPFLSDGIN
jgi:hypothetical protein